MLYEECRTIFRKPEAHSYRKIIRRRKYFISACPMISELVEDGCTE